MDFIKAYWEQQGSAHQSSHLASWGDRYAIELEIETISRFIKEGDRVLDIGCANGFSTFRQHEINRAARYTGVDYANSMIEHAQRSLSEKRLPPDEIRFEVASILALPFGDGAFDVAYTTRALINLPTWGGAAKGHPRVPARRAPEWDARHLGRVLGAALPPQQLASPV